MYGTIILRLMKEHSFETVYELAKKAGITQPGLKDIITGKTKKPQRSTLEKLCSVFSLTVVEFKSAAKNESDTEK